MSKQAKSFLQRHRVDLRKILYIVREEGKTVIHLEDGRTEETFITMKAIMEELPDQDFLRINKGYILPVSKIVEVVGGTYRMVDGRTFVGRLKDKGQHRRASRAVAARLAMENDAVGGPTVFGDSARSLYDGLTGLLEGEAFIKAASDVIRADKERASHFSILFSDIDNFAFANKRLGSERCDLLLKQLSDVLSSILPGYIMGGRLMGDDFCFLLRDADFEQVQSALELVSSWERAAGTSVSFGYAKIDPSLTVHGTISHAQIASREVKGVFGIRVSEYDEAKVSSALLSLRVVRDAEDALSTRQFKVFYQPIIEVKSGKPCGAEALVRWIHPELGWIKNADYIPLLEKSGFVPRLDEYVCHEVCRDLSRWIALGIQPLPVSINLSHYDFHRKNLAEFIKALVDSYDVPHELIHFELTELSYSNGFRYTKHIVEMLREYGFKIELGDFALGHASLNSLENLEFDVAKIDKSFVDCSLAEPGSSILEVVVSIAKKLGLKTVAEGVESRAQYDVLADYGCDAVQGYLFSQPLKEDRYRDYLLGCRQIATVC